jgi:hypothetical protein
VEDTLQGTTAELEELLEEMATAKVEGIRETRQVVMDVSGDTYYGAFCYTVAYRENIGTVWEQLVRSWKNSKGAVQEENDTSKMPQQCRHWYQPGQGQAQQPCQWVKEHQWMKGQVTIKVQGTKMEVQRWKVTPMEPEVSNELDMGHQGRVAAGFLFLTPEEKVATTVQVKRSLLDPKAVSMLAQSVVVAEAESRRCHKEQLKKQAQGRAAVETQAVQDHTGAVQDVQGERDDPQEPFFDCQVVTLGAELESKAEVWHEVQQMAEEDMPTEDRWKVEKHGKARKLKQAAGQGQSCNRQCNSRRCRQAHKQVWKKGNNRRNRRDGTRCSGQPKRQVTLRTGTRR